MVSGEPMSSFSSLVSVGNHLLSWSVLFGGQSLAGSAGSQSGCAEFTVESAVLVLAPLQLLLTESRGFEMSPFLGTEILHHLCRIQSWSAQLSGVSFSLSSLDWVLRPFTDIFCLYPVPALSQTPEEEAVCSKELCFPQFVQDCASLSLETQEQMGWSSCALDCVSALTWSSFPKPPCWCVGLSCSYPGIHQGSMKTWNIGSFRTA